MTPFMLAVSDVLDLPTDVDLPDIQASRRLPAAIGADAHVECRSLAEQLVCEANVVLAANDRERIDLTDDVRVGQLSFAMTFGDRQARIVTSIGDDVGSAASGNLQFNVAAGDNNVQDNAAALASTDAAFAFGLADSEIFVEQSGSGKLAFRQLKGCSSHE